MGAKEKTAEGMNLRRVKAVAAKEWIQVRRDYLSLAMAFLLPIILLIIYAYAITFDVDNIFTVVLDRDKSSLSRELISEFVQSRYFTNVAYLESYDDIDHYLDSGGARLAISIPSDFAKNIRTGCPAIIEIVIDGSESNTATIAQGYIAGILEEFNRRLGNTPGKAPIDVRSRVWYNPELKSRNFIIPGLIAIIMSVIIALLISLSVSREWERGTMEQLISTPVRPSELVTGKLAPYFVIGLADTILCIAISTVFLGVPLRGSMALLLSVSSIFLFGGLAFGILISIAARNQLLASQVAMLTSFLPSFMLSGFIFSIANMPGPLQLITYLVPARYFVSVLKGVFLKNIGLNLLFVQVFFLSLYGAVVFAMAVKKFKKRIEN
jgi:ABC-2 type transport system permease protein